MFINVMSYGFEMFINVSDDKLFIETHLFSDLSAPLGIQSRKINSAN